MYITSKLAIRIIEVGRGEKKGENDSAFDGIISNLIQTICKVTLWGFWYRILWDNTCVCVYDKLPNMIMTYTP